jgi:hypothetical protein
MKRVRSFSLVIFCLLSLVWLCWLVLAPIPPAQADNPEPAASGSVRVSMPDGDLRYVEFSARLDQNGSTSGQMTFRSPSQKADENLDGESHEGAEIKRSGSASEFFFKASFDCMVIKETRAVMSGTITEASSERYLGQRVVLVVQDKGEDSKTASSDKLTWGIYNSGTRSWIPSDAEVENDSGVGLRWLATDAERDDDVGLQPDKSASIGCQSFPLSSFSLVKVKNGDGDILVRP